MSALHNLLGKRALQLLPEWETAFWAEEMENMPEYCFYPDHHLAAQWGDPERFRSYEKYCIMPDGSCIPHGPVNTNGISMSLSGGIADSGLKDRVISYYLKTILKHLQNRDVTESARFAGTFAHFIQDSCISVHVMDNLLINSLFPPSEGKYHFYHRLVDNWHFEPDKIKEKPELLGRNIEEAAFIISEKIDQAVECGKKYMIPFLSAIRDGRKEEADRLSQLMNSNAVKFTADLWHTLFCIAFQKISPEEAEPLSLRFLTESQMILSHDAMFDRNKFIQAGIPFYETVIPSSDPCRSRLSTDPYPYEPAVNIAYDGKGDLIPLALQIEKKTVQSDKGIAAGAYGIASYHVPGNLFSELEVYAGVHPASASDQEITFAVWGYGLENPLMAFGKASRNTDALHFIIPIPEICHTISLLSAGGNRNTSAIWLNPVLKSRID